MDKLRSGLSRLLAGVWPGVRHLVSRHFLFAVGLFVLGVAVGDLGNTRTKIEYQDKSVFRNLEKSAKKKIPVTPAPTPVGDTSSPFVIDFGEEASPAAKPERKEKVIQVSEKYVIEEDYESAKLFRDGEFVWEFYPREMIVAVMIHVPTETLAVESVPSWDIDVGPHNMRLYRGGKAIAEYRGESYSFEKGYAIEEVFYKNSSDYWQPNWKFSEDGNDLFFSSLDWEWMNSRYLSVDKGEVRSVDERVGGFDITHDWFFSQKPGLLFTFGTSGYATRDFYGLIGRKVGDDWEVSGVEMIDWVHFEGEYGDGKGDVQLQWLNETRALLRVVGVDGYFVVDLESGRFEKVDGVKEFTPSIKEKTQEVVFYTVVEE